MGPRHAPACSGFVKPSPSARPPTTPSRSGTACSRPSRSGRPSRRWICCSTAGCCIRRWRAGSGDDRRSTSRAARSGSATSCRIRSRSFHSAPHLVRAQLLRAASRQFVEGDVQHWWHEPGGQGVRTRFSDDRLWLVFCSLLYVGATGDDAVWDEQVPFLEGRLLDEDEHEAYERPARARKSWLDLRALRARDRVEPRRGRAWPAAHGDRRLERRHEPRRRGWTRRERVARLVPGRRCCGPSPTSPRRAARRDRADRLPRRTPTS